MKPCNQCGKCCLRYGAQDLAVTRTEIERWEIERPDIFAYVHKDRIWYDPETQKGLDRCPWLVGDSAPYTCSIYADRPEDCRSYPADLADMIEDECEMIEARDLADMEAAKIKLRELS